MIKKDYIDFFEKESNYGKILKVSGPLIVAEDLSGAKMNELVHIGWEKLTGEIISLKGNTASIQCYENPVGLTIGDPVVRTKERLSVELGPGLLTQIYDGIQRSLEYHASESHSNFIPKGLGCPALNLQKQWDWVPSSKLKLNQIVAGGEIIGIVSETYLFNKHCILLPPKAKGRVTFIAPEGNYTVREKIIEVEDNGTKFEYTMSHIWPVRQPRPYVEKLEGDKPFFTGLRVLDSLFPSVLGGRIALPGYKGAGKSVIVEQTAKYSNTDINVYVGCGERGSELTAMLDNFINMTTTIKGKEESVMNKSCLVANTSDMPMTAREASIYTGVTIAEYYRDMGYNAGLMADSISRWAEALREISNRLGEVPISEGYPAYLSTRISQFYERAGRVKCLGTPDREGSLTILGTLSPPGQADFSEPVTSAAINSSQVFWGLDLRLASRKHFPQVNWLSSYSRYEKQVEDYFNEYDKDFSDSKQKIKAILKEEQEIIPTVKLFGRDTLTEQQKLVLEMGKLIREDFLQQDVFSYYDYFCTSSKTVGMMKCIALFFDEAKKAMDELLSEMKNSLNIILAMMKPLMIKLSKMKFESPKKTDSEHKEFFENLCKEIISAFEKFVFDIKYS